MAAAIAEEKKSHEVECSTDERVGDDQKCKKKRGIIVKASKWCKCKFGKSTVVEGAKTRYHPPAYEPRPNVIGHAIEKKSVWKRLRNRLERPITSSIPRDPARWFVWIMESPLRLRVATAEEAKASEEREKARQLQLKRSNRYADLAEHRRRHRRQRLGATQRSHEGKVPLPLYRLETSPPSYAVSRQQLIAFRARIDDLLADNQQPLGPDTRRRTVDIELPATSRRLSTADIRMSLDGEGLTKIKRVNSAPALGSYWEKQIPTRQDLLRERRLSPLVKDETQEPQFVEETLPEPVTEASQPTTAPESVIDFPHAMVSTKATTAHGSSIDVAPAPHDLAQQLRFSNLDHLLPSVPTDEPSIKAPSPVTQKSTQQRSDEQDDSPAIYPLELGEPVLERS